MSAAEQFPIPEHLRNRPPLNVDSVFNDRLLELRDAIIMDAVWEYADLIHDWKKVKKEPDSKAKTLKLDLIKRDASRVRRFFRSEWFKELTFGELDGDKIMDALKHDMPFKYLTKEEQEALKAKIGRAHV